MSPAEVHRFAHEERCLGPILRQNDFLALTDKSKKSSSFSLMYNSFCRPVTDGDINKIPSANNIILLHKKPKWHPVRDSWLLEIMLSIYTPNRYGDKTPPAEYHKLHEKIIQKIVLVYIL